MTDKQILKKIQGDLGFSFKLVDEIDYRDDMGQYTYDKKANAITGIKLARRATTVPDDIYLLKHLEVLDFSLAKIKSISDNIYNLQDLKKLNLYNTVIKKIPARIDILAKLENIHLGQTPITVLPDELCRLQNLRKLTLWGTKIRELPKDIGNLQKLERLDLSDCRLRGLPESIINLNIDFTLDEQEHAAIRIVGMELDDKKMLACARQGKEALSKYFQSDDYLYRSFDYEGKVVLLGKGAVGKTCLANALLNNFFDQNQVKTEGIDIFELIFDDNGKSACLHLWDFGGQEVYHPLYTLFMSEKAIYIIVLNGRSDDKPDEWLQFIKTFSPQSPVIIVINRIDENPRADINRELYLNKYPNIKEIVRCSCKNSDLPEGNIAQLKRAISSIIQTNECYSSNWNKSWCRVKDELENIPDSYITYSRFNEICVKNSIKDNKGKRLLLNKLNQLGIMLTYQQSTYNILNPNWLTKSLSCLYGLDIEKNGHLSIDKDVIFDMLYDMDSSYDMDKCEFIIQTLANFNLCYLHGNSVFLPGVLDICLEEKIDERYDDWYEVIWSYSVSPLLVMQRLIVRQFNSIYENNVWKNGVLLCLGEVKALVIQSELEIIIYVQNVNQIARRDCLNYIRNCIYDIHKELNFPEDAVTELIVLRANGMETLYPLDNLKKLLDMNVEQFPVPELRAMFSTKELLGEASTDVGDSTRQYQLKNAFDTIIDRLDSMQSSHIGDRQLLVEIVEQMKNMYNQPVTSVENKNKLAALLSKCGPTIQSILGGCSSATTVFTYFGISPQDILDTGGRFFSALKK